MDGRGGCCCCPAIVVDRDVVAGDVEEHVEGVVVVTGVGVAGDIVDGSSWSATDVAAGYRW